MLLAAAAFAAATPFAATLPPAMLISILRFAMLAAAALMLRASYCYADTYAAAVAYYVMNTICCFRFFDTLYYAFSMMIFMPLDTPCSAIFSLFMLCFRHFSLMLPVVAFC